MSLSPEQCFTKLNELKEWRKRQEKCLIEKQQNELQREMYRSTNGSDNTELYNGKKQLNRFINNSCDGGVRTPLQIIKESRLENKVDGDSENNKIAKRTFLKRGEGLKSRFGVHPDAFKLDNLPKYKYASRVNHVLNKNNIVRKRTKNSQDCNKVY